MGCATIKYSNAGVPLWTNRYNGPGNSDDFAWRIAVDGSGNAFVMGDSGTVAYSAAGVPLWTNSISGRMAVDGSGNLFVAGGSVGTNGYNDYRTVAYSEAGVPLWTNIYDGPANSNDYAGAIAVDSSGNVFVTGSSTGSGSGLDYSTIKYSAILPPVHLAIEPDGSGSYYIRFNGGPAFTYRLQRASALSGPWPDIATNTAPASGLVEFHDSTPLSGRAFYRTVQP